jgi:hypothetical protein
METPQLHNINNSIIGTENAIKLLDEDIRGNGGIAPPFLKLTKYQSDALLQRAHHTS